MTLQRERLNDPEDMTDVQVRANEPNRAAELAGSSVMLKRMTLRKGMCQATMRDWGPSQRAHSPPCFTRTLTSSVQTGCDEELTGRIVASSAATYRMMAASYLGSGYGFGRLFIVLYLVPQPDDELGVGDAPVEG